MPPRTRKKQTKIAGPRPLTRARKAKRFCSAGRHEKPQSWRPGWGCWQCERDAEDPVAERERRKDALGLSGRPPAELTIRVVETGQLVIFRIPAHCRRRPLRARRIMA